MSTTKSTTASVKKTIEIPYKDKDGKFAKGNKASGGAGGRPCEFCPQHEEIIKKFSLYTEYCKGKVDEHIHCPFLEEICGDYLDILAETLWQWVANDKEMPHDLNHNRKYHAELSKSVKALLQFQKRFLLNHSLFNNQVSGAIFQLKANHGMIETEKRILAGDKENKLEIIITEEDRKKDGE